MKAIIDKWKKIPITVKAATAYTFCNILQRCLSFITLPLFTRLLSTEEYGQVTIYQSWQSILSIILTLNLAYGSFSTAMIKYKDREGYISSVEGICLTLAALFLMIYLPFHDFWNQIFELPTELVCIMVVEMLGLTALLLWNGKKRFEYKYRSVIIITLSISVISPIVQYFFVISSENKGYARIFGSAIVSIIFGGTLFLFNIIKGRHLYNREFWTFALTFNIPLLAYYLSQIIFNQSDRIMISHIVGKDKAAMYGVAYSLATVLTFILNAINSAYVPWYYEKIKKGNISENKAVSLGIAILMASLLLIIIWFAPEVIYIMAGAKYSEAVYVVPPVSISLLLLFYSQLFINVEFYYEQKKKLVEGSIGAAILNLALNWIFISKFGFIAAAYTTLASYIVFAFSNYRALFSILDKESIDEGFNKKGLLILLIIFIVLSYFGVLLYPFFAIRIILCVFFFITLMIKRNYFIGLYKSIRVAP